MRSSAAGAVEVGEGTGDRSLLLACGALAREILEIIRLNGWKHLELHCLPADLHLYPDRIPAAVEAAYEKRKRGYKSVLVVYADCGTGGLLEAKCRELGLEMIEGPHCYAFYDGLERFAKHSEGELTAFYLTDFLVKQFDAFVWKPLGLDAHPELRDAYFGNYDRLIYLAQTDAPELHAKARHCAERLGLAYERRLTGYGDLETGIRHFAKSAGSAKGESGAGESDAAEG